MQQFCKQTGKHSHKSQRAARAQLVSLNKREKYNGEIYPCPFCEGWHVGRLRFGAHRNRYKPKKQHLDQDA